MQGEGGDAPIPNPRIRRPVVGVGSTSPTSEGQPAETAETTTPAGPSTTPQPADDAELIAQQDLARSRQLNTRAAQCCNNPASCGTITQPKTQSTGGGGMNSCQEQSALQSSGSDLNRQYASICYGEQTRCQGPEDQLVEKYEGLVRNCANTCEAAGIYSSTLSQLKTIRKQCNDLLATADAYSAQSSANASAGGSADACKNTSQIAAQSAGGGDEEENREEDLAQSSKTECERNPSSPECSNQKPSAEATTEPGAATSEGKSLLAGAVDPNAGRKSLDDFNPGSVLDAGLRTGNEGAAQPSDPLQYNTVANNSGGGIPGGSGGGGGAPSAKPRAYYGSKVSTDIMTGFQGGGGYSQDPGGMQAQGGNGERYSNYGKFRGPASANAGAKHALQGVDLKRYLPGGDLAPSRMAGMGGPNSQINGKSADIWKIIHNKFTERCKLGTLYSCDK
jgi:hypothetical protein